MSYETTASVSEDRVGSYCSKKAHSKIQTEIKLKLIDVINTILNFKDNQSIVRLYIKSRQDKSLLLDSIRDNSSNQMSRDQQSVLFEMCTAQETVKQAFQLIVRLHT